MKGFLNGQASKFLVAVAGAALTGLGTYYGTARWEPVVAGVISAVLVYLVPNSPKQLAGKRKTPPGDGGRSFSFPEDF